MKKLILVMAVLLVGCEKPTLAEIPTVWSEDPIMAGYCQESEEVEIRCDLDGSLNYQVMSDIGMKRRQSLPRTIPGPLPVCGE
jgi:hypothetical protein